MVKIKLLKKKSVIANSEDSKKLLRHSTMTNGHLDWCIHEHYLDLLKNFRKGKIQTFEFCISFENTGKLTSDISVARKFIGNLPHHFVDISNNCYTI